MGAGQIGGIATLLDIDFDNAEGFLGVKADVTEGQYLTYFLSHTMLFCAGALIEPGVVLTAASCVYGEKYAFEIFAGTHLFLENSGAKRTVHDICLHRKANKTHNACPGENTCKCYHENLALLILDTPISLQYREPGAQFTANRLRYGYMDPVQRVKMIDEGIQCHLYGWGSRRNGYLVPLLLNAMRVDVTLLNPSNCDAMWPFSDSRYLCVLQPPCRSKKYGALCPVRNVFCHKLFGAFKFADDNSHSRKCADLKAPIEDDMGSVIECGGTAVGLMASRFVDRPCGVGFLDLNNFYKFLTCGVDDAREVAGGLSRFLELKSHHLRIPSTIPSTKRVPARKP